MPFTYYDFRANAELRQVWSEFLHSDIGMILMRVLREKYRPTDVPVGLDALASARILSQFHGAHLALDDLEALAMPPGLDEKEVAMTFQAPESDHERMPSEAEMTARMHPALAQTDGNEPHNVG